MELVKCGGEVVQFTEEEMKDAITESLRIAQIISDLNSKNSKQHQQYNDYVEIIGDVYMMSGGKIRSYWYNHAPFDINHWMIFKYKFININVNDHHKYGFLEEWSLVNQIEKYKNLLASKRGIVKTIERGGDQLCLLTEMYEDTYSYVAYVPSSRVCSSCKNYFKTVPMIKHQKSSKCKEAKARLDAETSGFEIIYDKKLITAAKRADIPLREVPIKVQTYGPKWLIDAVEIYKKNPDGFSISLETYVKTIFEENSK